MNLYSEGLTTENVCTLSHRTELGGGKFNNLHKKKLKIFPSTLFFAECYAAGYVIANDFSVRCCSRAISPSTGEKLGTRSRAVIPKILTLVTA